MMTKRTTNQALKQKSPHSKAIAAATEVTDQLIKADWKLRQAEVAKSYKEAIQRALEMGECPVLTTWDTRVDRSDRFAVVLCDTATGEPIITPDGEYIFDSDQMTDVPTEELDETGQPVMASRFAKVPEMPVGMAGAGSVWTSTPLSRSSMPAPSEVPPGMVTL